MRGTVPSWCCVVMPYMLPHQRVKNLDRLACPSSAIFTQCVMLANMTHLDATLLVALILSPFIVLAIERLRAVRRPCMTPRCPRVATWRTLDHRQWCHQCLGAHLLAAGLILGRAK